MDFTLTLALLGATLAAGAACGWMGARPPNPARGPRMAPYRFLMIFAAAIALMLLVHAVNLLGVTTGR